MIHTLEYRYIVPRYYWFLHDLKHECQENKYNQVQKAIYSILTNNAKQMIGYQMNLPNEGIRIRYPSTNNPMNYLYLIANVPKMLDKNEIEDSDLNSFKEIYHSIIHKRMFYNNPFLTTETLNRIDYKLDYKCKDSHELSKLLEVLSKARNTRYSAKKATV